MLKLRPKRGANWCCYCKESKCRDKWSRFSDQIRRFLTLPAFTYVHLRRKGTKGYFSRKTVMPSERRWVNDGIEW